MTRVIAWTFVLGLLVFFFSRGFTYTDEGFILSPAQRILWGQTIYKDFLVVYTPLSIFATALIFKILGPSVFAGRVLSLLVCLATVFVLFRLSRGRTAPVLIYLFWLPSHINYPAPAAFAVLASLACLLTYLTHRPFLSGIFLVLTILSKQNFGAGLLLALTAVYFLARKIDLKKFFMGAILALGIFAVYLISSGSFKDFFVSQFFYLVKIGREGIGSAAFPTGFPKVIFYLLPLLLSGLGLWSSYRRDSWLFAANSLVLFTYLTGISPITDLIHLIPLLAISGLSLTSKKTVVVAAALGLQALGLGTAVYKNYYRWQPPISFQSQFSNHPKMQVFTTPHLAREISDISAYVALTTSPGDPIFLNYYSPLFYFIVDRPNATRFEYLSYQATTPEQKQEIIKDLQSKQVKLVVTHILNSAEVSPVTHYIKENFVPDRTINDWKFYKKL